MGKTCKIWTVAKNLLRERLALVTQEVVPRWATIRNFFYEARNRYLKENPDRLTIDSTDQNPYLATHKLIKAFCKKHAEEFEIEPALWWRLRDQLNIHPQGRATCKGESGEFMITKDKRKEVVKDCSFILVCEKDTIIHNLLPALKAENYKLNVVTTGGNSPADVQEVVLAIRDELGDDARFYILVLHDYDLAGVRILVTLKQRYNGVIDLGVNRQFIKFLDEHNGFDARLAEEQVLNKNLQTELRNLIESGICPEYTLEDFNTLQGEKLSDRKWAGKRIEIDAIEVMYGIQPFVDYTLAKIQEECTVWDLSRIGVTEYYLEEPDNHYKDAISIFEVTVGHAYGLKLHDLSKTMNTVLDKVKSAFYQPDEYEELTEKYRKGDEHWWRTTIDSKSIRYNRCETVGVQELKDEYSDQIKHSWIDDHDEALHEINKQIKRYEGDVREGEDDLDNQHTELQEQIETDKANDPDLETFKEKLNKIEYGKDELVAIEIPSPIEEVRTAIEVLEEYLEELENEEQP